jgi:hypothetical protein
MGEAERVPGVYLVAQTDSGWNRTDRGVFHGTLLDEREKHQPLCGRKFTVRPMLTRDAGRMVNRRPCSRCYGPTMQAITVLRADHAALQEKSTE